MKRYMWKRKDRRIGQYFYRIRRKFNPDGCSYEYVLQRSEYGLFAKPYERVHCTQRYSVAEEWSDEMGLKINEQPDVIRKPLI